jgi:hypothetical protein
VSSVRGIRKIIQLGDIVIMKLRVLPRDVGKFPDGVNRSSIVPVDESDGTPSFARMFQGPRSP